MIKRLLITLASLFLIPLAVTAPAFAQSQQILNNLDEQCAKALDSVVCKERNTANNPVSGTSGAVLRITRFIAIVAGVAAVIMIIISGLRFIMSHGDPQTVNGAKNTILYAVIGLVVIIVAQGIITLVVRSLQ